MQWSENFHKTRNHLAQHIKVTKRRIQQHDDDKLVTFKDLNPSLNEVCLCFERNNASFVVVGQTQER